MNLQKSTATTLSTTNAHFFISSYHTVVNCQVRAKRVPGFASLCLERRKA